MPPDPDSSPPPNAVPFPATSPPPGPAPEPPPLPPREALAPRRRFGPLATGFLGGLVGGVLVIAIAIGGTVALWSGVRGWVVGNLDQRVATLSARLDAIDRQVEDRLPVRAAPPALPPTTAPAPASVAPPAAPANALADGQQLADLAKRVDALSSQLDALKAAMPTEGTIATLAARTEEALQTARDLADRRRSDEATMLAVGQLRDAIERGDPYRPELTAVRRVASDSDRDALDALATTADAGVAPRAVVIADFPATADAATAAAMTSTAGSDLLARIARQAAALIRIRRVDGNGADTAAILTRAQQRIDQGDLAGAVAEVKQLDGPPAAAFTAWLTRASQRLAAEQALSQLEADLAARLGSAKG